MERTAMADPSEVPKATGSSPWNVSLRKEGANARQLQATSLRACGIVQYRYAAGENPAKSKRY